MSHVTSPITAPDAPLCTMYKELIKKYGLPDLEAPSPPPSDGFPDLPALSFETGDWLCDNPTAPIREVGDMLPPKMSMRQWRMLDALTCL